MEKEKKERRRLEAISHHRSIMFHGKYTYRSYQENEKKKIYRCLVPSTMQVPIFICFIQRVIFKIYLEFYVRRVLLY